MLWLTEEGALHVSAKRPSKDWLPLWVSAMVSVLELVEDRFVSDQVRFIPSFNSVLKFD